VRSELLALVNHILTALVRHWGPPFAVVATAWSDHSCVSLCMTSVTLSVWFSKESEWLWGLDRTLADVVPLLVLHPSRAFCLIRYVESSDLAPHQMSWRDWSTALVRPGVAVVGIYVGLFSVSHH
jgi:hypothetical protein